MFFFKAAKFMTSVKVDGRKINERGLYLFMDQEKKPLAVTSKSKSNQRLKISQTLFALFKSARMRTRNDSAI